MISNILTYIQIAIGMIGICFWGFGMYYWHHTNKNLRPGVSSFVFLNPFAYLHSEYFSPAGIKYRKSAVISFAAMLFFILLAYALRTLREMNV